MFELTYDLQYLFWNALSLGSSCKPPMRVNQLRGLCREVVFVRRPIHIENSSCAQNEWSLKGRWSRQTECLYNMCLR